MQNDAGKIKLLHSETRPQAWDNWLQDTSVKFLKVQSEQNFAHFYFCLQAVVDNLGAAIGSYPLVMDDLQRGNLVAPFGFKRSGHSYILLSQDNREPEIGSVQERNFSSWLKLNLAKCVPES